MVDASPDYRLDTNLDGGVVKARPLERILPPLLMLALLLGGQVGYSEPAVSMDSEATLVMVEDMETVLGLHALRALATEHLGDATEEELEALWDLEMRMWAVSSRNYDGYLERFLWSMTHAEKERFLPVLEAYLALGALAVWKSDEILGPGSRGAWVVPENRQELEVIASEKAMAALVVLASIREGCKLVRENQPCEK